jgi:hypothetical protein
MTLEPPLRSALLFGLLALAGGAVGCFGPYGFVSVIGGLAATGGLIGAYKSLRRLRARSPETSPENAPEKAA